MRLISVRVFKQLLKDRNPVPKEIMWGSKDPPFHNLRVELGL